MQTLLVKRFRSISTYEFRQLLLCCGWLSGVMISCCVFVSNKAYADHSASNHSPVHTNSQVDLAVEKRQQGLVYDSIAILEQLKTELTSNVKLGDNVKISLELAISYIKAHQHDKAQAQVTEMIALNPSMKDNKRIQKLQEMISTAKQKAQDSKHQFKGEITFYRGFDELTAKYPYFEITEFEDHYQVERKEESIKFKEHYIGGRAIGEYRYTPVSSFNWFGQPTYSFWNNRITHFEKHSLNDHNVYFGFDSFDSSYFLMQPKRWAFNAKVKWKWHTYHGERSITEKTVDVNGSVLLYGARVKMGVHRSSNALNETYAEELFGEFAQFTQLKSTVVSPYIRVSYRFSPSLLWTVGSRRRSVQSNDAELEGKVMNYSTTLRYSVNDNFDVHTSFYYDDLSYEVVDLDLGLHSGELKQSLVIGMGYQLTDNLQIGLNGLYMDKKQNDDFGQDQYKRLEAFVRYRF